MIIYYTDVLFYPTIQSQTLFGGARGVVVIVVGNGHGDTRNGHGDTSSNPGPD